MMEQAVEYRRGKGAVVVEDLGPLLERLVGRQDNGASLVALADHLEEQVGPVVVDGQVSEFVDDEHLRAQVLA